MTKEEYYRKFDSVLSAELRRFCEHDSLCTQYTKDTLKYYTCNDEATIEDTVDGLTNQEKVALLTVDRWPEKTIESIVDKSQNEFEKIIFKNFKVALKKIAEEEGVQNTFIEEDA